MNENIDLTKILKDCPNGWKLYSTVLGYVTFEEVNNDNEVYPILVSYKDGLYESFTADGKMIMEHEGECTLFPSKDQRDWSKFTAPWYKKERFDPNTLKAFDKVIVSNIQSKTWRIEYFSHIDEISKPYLFYCLQDNYAYCIPYNDDTKHLVGTKEEAPEYYRYW